MTRVDEFDSFYNAGFDGVLQVTYAVCGDRQLALEATVDAFRKAWRSWPRIRDGAPLPYVRSEAFKVTSLNRSTHLRRRKGDQSPAKILQALDELPTDQRRLLVLMTLGNIDLEAASREVGLRAEDGIEMATDALGALETSTGESIAELEKSLLALNATTADLNQPPAASIRRSARRGGQRNTIALAAATVLAIVGSGFFVVDSDDATARQVSLPQREKLGSEGADIVLDARNVSEDDLLSTKQVSRLNPRATWKLDGTDAELSSTQPYATCPTTRFGDPDPLRVFVRQFSAPQGAARVAESVEISRTEDASKKSAKTLMDSFANCAHPRVQLISANKVDRPFGDFTILKLRANRSPQRTFTVGFAQSGAISSTVVHEADGVKGPAVDDFAQVLNDSLAKVCKASGGNCSSADVSVTSAAPPPTKQAPAFLGIVDLPAIKDVNRVWTSVPIKVAPNRAATPCDAAKFTGQDISNAASRIFLLYNADEVPQQFGVNQTVGRFKSTRAAKDFVNRVSNRIESCSDRNPTAKIDQRSPVKGDAAGQIWRVGVEADGATAYYRTGVVRRGPMVTQVTLVTAKSYDIDRKTFGELVQRAGVRLRYAK